VYELNSPQTEKCSLLLKIQDLEEMLLETQLHIESVTDEKLTHVLSIQKCPTNKTRLGYVASTSDIPSTSKIVFVKPTVPEPPPACVDKAKTIIGGKGPINAKIIKKPPIKRSPPICPHCCVRGHIQPKCPQRQDQKKPSRHAPSGTRPQARCQAPQYQRQQYRFVPINQKWIPKKDTSKHYKETL
jgi:hypothetical protein